MQSKHMVKSLFLYYYSEKGYGLGLFFTMGYLASMITLLLLGLVCLSESILDDGILKSIFSGNVSFGNNSRGMAQFSGKLFAIILLIVLAGLLYVPSYFFYRNWTVDFDKMDYLDRQKTISQGKKVMNVFGIFAVIVSVGGVFIMIANFS